MAERKKSYFLDNVLPSVDIPEKGSYNVAEVCRILSVSRRTLQRMITDGRLQVVHTGSGQKTRNRLQMVHKQVLIDFFKEWDEGGEDAKAKKRNKAGGDSGL